MPLHDHDLISDIMQRLADRLGADVLPREVLMSVERGIRKDWSGDRVYIAAAKQGFRNDSIRQKFRAGDSVEQLAARYQLSRRRIRQILRQR